MKLLELFSGTGSVGRVAKELGYTVVSLDLKDADINQDLLKWDYKNIDKDFGFVWASPPCTEYSIAKTTGVRKIDEANEIAKKTIEIIKYFEPKYWFIENPQTGLLKQQEFMKDFDFLMLIIVNMECHTENAPAFGQTKKFGHLNRYVKRTADTWKGTGIGKQLRECQVERKKHGKKTIHYLSKGTCIEYPKS